jgi:hypothetical protein
MPRFISAGGVSGRALRFPAFFNGAAGLHVVRRRDNPNACDEAMAALSDTL